MVYHKEIARLEQQRQLLIAQSELNRVLLTLEFKELEGGAGKAAWVLDYARKSFSFLLPTAFLAGILLTRKGFTWRKFLAKTVLGWTLLRRIGRYWKTFRNFAIRR